MMECLQIFSLSVSKTVMTWEEQEHPCTNLTHPTLLLIIQFFHRKESTVPVKWQTINELPSIK